MQRFTTIFHFEFALRREPMTQRKEMTRSGVVWQRRTLGRAAVDGITITQGPHIADSVRGICLIPKS